MRTSCWGIFVYKAMKSYIYMLLDPFEAMVGYVGKSVDPEGRYYQHLNDRHTNKGKIRWILKLQKLGSKPLLYILEETDTKHESIRESFWIDEVFKMGYQLLNIAKVYPRERIISENQRQRELVAGRFASKEEYLADVKKRREGLPTSFLRPQYNPLALERYLVERQPKLKESLATENQDEHLDFLERMQKAKKERALANKIAREQALEARRLEITEHAKNWKEPAPIEPKPNLVLATPQKPASFYLKIVYELLYWGSSAYACYKLFLAFKIIYAFYGR